MTDQSTHDKAATVEMMLTSSVGACFLEIQIMRSDQGAWRERWSARLIDSGIEVILWPVHPETEATLIASAIARRLQGEPCDLAE